jgi:hypothetical protein
MLITAYARRLQTMERRMLTWRCLPQEHLQMRDQLHNVVWRSRPEDEAVARILESRFNIRLF